MMNEVKVCSKCGKDRRITQFSYLKGYRWDDRKRSDICRPCNIDGIPADEPHKILKEIYRNYLVYRESIMRGEHTEIITYPAETTKGSGEYIELTFSFSDLAEGVSELAPRKKEAFFLHVICDKLQREVGEIMNCTPVTVGQYVENACLELSKRYFGSEEDE